nr:metalloregulator ArsR/SmtB family transcription factor [uncultured Gellertiella sp.]
MTTYSDPLDQMFHALSDPTRRAILARLVEAGDASVSEVTAPFGMARPTLLKHVQVLEESGLIRTRKQGRVRLCRVEPQAIKTTEDWLVRQRRLWEQRLGQLDAYVLALSKTNETEEKDSDADHV